MIIATTQEAEQLNQHDKADAATVYRPKPVQPFSKIMTTFIYETGVERSVALTLCEDDRCLANDFAL